MHLRLSDDAQDDLRGLQDYIQPRSQQGYQRMMAAIFAAFDQLESFPFLGHVGEVGGTRELTVPRTPYRIIYSLPDQYHVDVEARVTWPSAIPTRIAALRKPSERFNRGGQIKRPRDRRAAIGPRPVAVPVRLNACFQQVKSLIDHSRHHVRAAMVGMDAQHQFFAAFL